MLYKCFVFAGIILIDIVMCMYLQKLNVYFYCYAGYQKCPALPVIQYGTKFKVTGSGYTEVANTNVPCDDVTDGNSCHYQVKTELLLSHSPLMFY